MSKIKRFFRRKSLLRNIIVGILIVVTLGAAAGGVVALTRNTDKIDDALTYKTISSTSFSVGGLDSNGNYMSTDQSIYTKKVFECQGLNVTPDFDNTVSYQIYFYDQNNEFVHTTGKLTGAFVQDSVPFFAKYARIVITPNDDTKVTIFEVLKYAKQLEIKVYREQGFKNYTENLFVEDYHSMSINEQTGVITSTDSGTTCISTKINILGYTGSMMFRGGFSGSSEHLRIYCYNKENSYIGSTSIANEMICDFVSSLGVRYYNVDISHLGDFSEDIVFIRVASSNTMLLEVFFR